MKDLIDKLQQLEIPKREGEVYLALLQKKEFTAPEIAKITSVSRTKSYEVLQNLVKKGLCNESYRDGIKVFSAGNPKIVFENILYNYENKKRIVNQLNENLGEMYKKIENNTQRLDYIQILTDINQIRKRSLEIQENTKRELLAFTKPPYAMSVEDSIDAEEEAIKNKIVIRSIYEYKDINSQTERESFIKMVETYQKLGEEVKVFEELPMKLAISDETITMLALTDRISLKPSITTIIVDHPNYAKAQKEVFKAFWTMAISIEEFKQS